MKGVHHIIALSPVALLLSALLLSPARAQWGSPSDGERAYQLACSILWASGNLVACQELPWHPCRPSNPDRPEACDTLTGGHTSREVPSG